MKKSNYYMNESKFMYFIATLFRNYGYKIKLEQQINHDYKADMIITFKHNDYIYDNTDYICEVKYSSSLNLSSQLFYSTIKRLSILAAKKNTGILITNSLCTEEQRNLANKMKIFIFDISNFLYLVPKNSSSYLSLLSYLNFSIDSILPKEPEIPIITKNQIDKTSLLNNWESRFKEIPPGIENFKQYEELCIDALRFLFSNYLSLWEKQKKSNADLYRFDLICKIKHNITNEFFSTLENYFNSKYIVFEFKNYSEQITPKEIYTTERYLYDKALRKVAIVISRKGENKNALQEIKGCLRNRGILIISLSDEEVLKMLNEGHASDYLEEKLDRLLIELEK